MESRDGDGGAGGGGSGWSDAATPPVVERRRRGDEGDAARRSAAAARDDAALDPLVSIMMGDRCTGWFGRVEGRSSTRPSWDGWICENKKWPCDIVSNNIFFFSFV
jgi:hypothetical protein